MKVAPHTSLKHRMLGMYFLICRQVAKKRYLYYVDLYAGDGEAECEEAPIKKWKCPFITSLLEHAEKEIIKLKCFLNEFDPENKGTFIKLKQNVSCYKRFIVSLTQEDANIIYKTAIEKIPKNEWSIFFLDPFKYNDLNWETIANISAHEGYDISNRITRKPELIINLSTGTMQRAFKRDPDGLTKALGTDAWKERIKNKTDEKMHEIFSDIFTEKLEKLGYFVTLFQIKQTPPNDNTLYYLVFASNVPAAHEIMEKKYKPYVDKIMNDKWVKENFRYRMITQARKRGDQPLDTFFNQNS